MTVKKVVLEDWLHPDLIPCVEEVGEDEYFLKHQLVWRLLLDNPFEKNEYNYLVNQWYEKVKKVYQESLVSKDWENVLDLISRPFRTQTFIENYRKIYRDIGEDRYYTLLGNILVGVELHYYTRKSYSKLINIGSDPRKMMDEIERKRYDELPERFTIYRGVDSQRKITTKNFKKFIGNSWTIDKEKSIWFSTRGHPYSVVFSIEISKSQVLSYFTNREEDEIFIDFTRLDLSKIRMEVVNKENNELILQFGMEGGGESIFRVTTDGTTLFIRKFSYMKFDLDDWETGEERIDSLDSFWNSFTKDPHWYRFHPVKVHKDYRELVLESLYSIDLKTLDSNQRESLEQWVTVIMTGKYDSDYPFKNLCRLHQSHYRSDILKVWFDDDINVIKEEDGLKGLNFFEGFDILKSVEERYGNRYKGGFRKPLYCNLLRSEHIPFNLFTPFKHDLDFGKKVFNEILGGIIDHIIEIKIEYPEDTPTEYLKDRTSFDTYIEYQNIDGSLGIIGIEVKYTELSYKIGVKEKNEMDNPSSLYYQRSGESGVFLTGDFDTLRKLSKDDYRQVWRNHLLGESILIVERPKYGHFHSLTFYPDGNTHFTEVIKEYQEFLKPESHKRVQGVTYERFFEICQKHIPIDGFDKWLGYLERRYLLNNK